MLLINRYLGDANTPTSTHPHPKAQEHFFLTIFRWSLFSYSNQACYSFTLSKRYIYGFEQISNFLPPEIDASKVLFHLMEIDLESVRSKSFELFSNSFLKATYAAKIQTIHLPSHHMLTSVFTPSRSPKIKVAWLIRQINLRHSCPSILKRKNISRWPVFEPLTLSMNKTLWD